MAKINKNKLGLIGGIFVSFIHLVWALMIAIMPSTFQKTLDWMLAIHFLEPIYKITAFNITSAILLVIITFIAGYVLGWVLGFISNIVNKK